jgi:hypothetical protein
MRKQRVKEQLNFIHLQAPPPTSPIHGEQKNCTHFLRMNENKEND